MKIINCEQYSPEWESVRLGIPTASEFHRIITAVKGDFSKSADKYAYGLVAETLLRRSLEKPQVNAWAMQRGRELEPAAAAQYEFLTDTEVSAVGFVTSDDGRIGCSPDRLVSLAALNAGSRGGLEIKCTLDENHVGIYFDGPGEDYKQQVQGSLLVADELEWWDLHAYHPDLPARTIRNFRDEPYLAKMRSALSQFLEMRDAMLAKAIESGFFEERIAAVVAAEQQAVGPAPVDLDRMLGLDAVQAGLIVAAGKGERTRRKPKLEPAVSAKLAEAAAASSQAVPPVPAPVTARITETPPEPSPAGATTPASSSKPPSGKQAALLALLTRPAGATRKEMLAATGAKAGASPATCIKLAQLFGYAYVYCERTAEAPTSYRLVRDSGAEVRAS